MLKGFNNRSLITLIFFHVNMHDMKKEINFPCIILIRLIFCFLGDLELLGNLR